MASSAACRASGGAYRLPPCINCHACDRLQVILESPDPAWWDNQQNWETVGWLVKFVFITAFVVFASYGCAMHIH